MPKLSQISRPCLLAAPAIALALIAAGCATNQPSAPRAVARLQPTSGSQTTGTVWLTQEGDHVVVRVSVSGLMPNREHGFHVHEKGDCSAPDGSSAGGHFNPAGKPHGAPGAEHHAGDMPSLKADGSGNANTTFEIRGVLLGTGATDLMGKGLIVHADPDDYATQPTGNSGKRIACGVIASPATPTGMGEAAKTIPKQM
ncbi:MAG: superoxide dismutase family protein [Rhizobacter sp.]